MAASAVSPFQPDPTQAYGTVAHDRAASRLKVVPRGGAGTQGMGREVELATELLTPEALSFLSDLHRQFEPRRQQLISRRAQRQAAFDSGHFPDFLYGTRHVRQTEWRVGPATAAAFKKTVPQIRVIGAPESAFRQASGKVSDQAADCVVDMEAIAPADWAGLLEAHAGMAGTTKATTWVRCRGLHRTEKNMPFGGAPMSAALFDAGLHCFHGGRALLERRTAPSFYLSGLEGHEEARWWNEALASIEQQLTLRQGSIQATLAIETLPAAFEMEEMMYELRERCAALAFGRDNYLCSYIKVFRKHPEFMLPESDGITMDHPLLRSALDLMVHSSHKRGALALGPLSGGGLGHPGQTRSRMEERFYLDKLRDARAGCDGSLVADADQIAFARAAFVEEKKWASVASEANDHIHISARDLLSVPHGTITAQGLESCVRLGLDHLAVAMGVAPAEPAGEAIADAAKAELARMQVRQWLQGCARLEDGRAITRHLLEDTVREAVARASSAASALVQAQYLAASRMFLRWCSDVAEPEPMADA